MTHVTITHQDSDGKTVATITTDAATGKMNCTGPDEACRRALKETVISATRKIKDLPSLDLIASVR